MARSLLLMLSTTFLVIAMAMPTVAWGQTPVTEITDPEGKQLIVNLDKSINDMSSAMGACVSAGKDPATCRCANKDKLANVKKTVEDALQKRPDWRNQGVSTMTTNAQNKTIGISLNIPALASDVANPACP